jgi:hypothetical protein
MEKVNLSEKFALFNELVKFKWPFTWHHHNDEDELFL